MKDTYNAAYKTGLSLGYSPVKAAAFAYTTTACLFADKVKIGGDWDYKKNLVWNQNYNCKINGKIYVVRGDDIGNIHYGYVGKALFPDVALKSAAGLVQIVGGEYKLSWYKTYFDDPNDQKAIDRGIYYYKNGVFK